MCMSVIGQSLIGMLDALPVPVEQKFIIERFVVSVGNTAMVKP